LLLFFAEPSGRLLGFLILSTCSPRSGSHCAICTLLVVCSWIDFRNCFTRSENVFHGSVEGGTDTIAEYWHSLLISIGLGSPGTLGGAAVSAIEFIAGGVSVGVVMVTWRCRLVGGVLCFEFGVSSSIISVSGVGIARSTSDQDQLLPLPWAEVFWHTFFLNGRIFCVFAWRKKGVNNLFVWFRSGVTAIIVVLSWCFVGLGFSLYVFIASRALVAGIDGFVVVCRV
jgi:hypothetical protein